MSNQDRAEGVRPLAYYVEAARSQIGPMRPDDPDDAEYWDGLTAAIEALQPRDAAGGLPAKLSALLLATEIRKAGDGIADPIQRESVYECSRKLDRLIAAPQAPGGDTAPATTEGEVACYRIHGKFGVNGGWIDGDLPDDAGELIRPGERVELAYRHPAESSGGEAVVMEWRWLDEKGRAMTKWKQGEPPPMSAVSDEKGTMRVEVRNAAIASGDEHGR